MKKRDSNLIGYFEGVPIYISDKPDKKYYALRENRKIYFGSSKHEHYYDKLGHYSHLDHLDPQRRKAFKDRFENIRHKVGTAAYYSDQLLW